MVVVLISEPLLLQSTQIHDVIYFCSTLTLNTLYQRLIIANSLPDTTDYSGSEEKSFLFSPSTIYMPLVNFYIIMSYIEIVALTFLVMYYTTVIYIYTDRLFLIINLRS